jgi:alpha-L-fucosidase
LVELVAKGTNCLLNIGPRADGSIPEQSVAILEEIGRWMEVNREAVHGTSASPFPTEFEWGRAAVKKNNLYLFLFEVPEKLELTGLRSGVHRATYLAAPNNALEIEQRHDVDTDHHLLALQLGANVSGGPFNVIRLELEGEPDVSGLPCQQPNGSICLPAHLAGIQNERAGTREETASAKDTAVAAENFNLAAARGMEVTVSGVVENWFDTRGYVYWDFTAASPGAYQLELRTFAKKYEPWVGGHEVRVECNGQVLECCLRPDTEPDTAYRQYFNETGSFLGILHLNEPGHHRLALKALSINPEDKAGLAVRMLILRKHIVQDYT